MQRNIYQTNYLLTNNQYITMWCDIHLAIEKKNKKTWKRSLLNKWNIVEEYDGNETYLYSYVSEQFKDIDRRNYNNFCIMAWVRDYRWGYKPMQSCRWIPEDSCNIIHERRQQWEWDAHSDWWLTFDEVLNYDVWDQDIQWVTVIDCIKEFQSKSKIKDMSLFRLVFFFDN